MLSPSAACQRLCNHWFKRFKAKGSRSASLCRLFKAVMAVPKPKQNVWLSPVTFPLGIARQTFLHEAIHAVQSCPTGRLTPIGWRLKVSPVVEREIGGILMQSYHHSNRVLEREAFFMQGQPDAVAQVIAALHERCP